MESLSDTLRQIEDNVSEIRANLWPDEYAPGGTVDRLAREVERLCEVVGALVGKVQK